MLIDNNKLPPPPAIITEWGPQWIRWLQALYNRIGDEVKYCSGRLSTADQTTNISVGDHIKFNNELTARELSLDTSTTYTSSSGDSIGRIMLQGGHTYLMYASLRCDFGSGGGTRAVAYRWYQDDGTAVGSSSFGYAKDTNTSGTNDGKESIALFTPVDDVLVEVRITSINSVDGFLANHCDFTIFTVR